MVTNNSGKYFQGYVKRSLENLDSKMDDLSKQVSDIHTIAEKNSKEQAVINTKLKIYTGIAAFIGGITASIVTVVALTQ